MKYFTPIFAVIFLLTWTGLNGQIPDHLTQEQKEKVHEVEKENDKKLDDAGQLTDAQKEKADRYDRQIEKRIESGGSTEWRERQNDSSGKSKNSSAGSSINSSTNSVTKPPEPKPPHVVKRELVVSGYPASIKSGSPGHAFVTIEITMSDGSIRTLEYSKYGLSGNGANPINARESGNRPDASEYYRKDISPEQFRGVLEVVKEELDESYNFFNSNCVGFVDKVAKSASIITPDKSSWTKPETYLSELTFLNQNSQNSRSYKDYIQKDRRTISKALEENVNQSLSGHGLKLENLSGKSNGSCEEFLSDSENLHKTICDGAKSHTNPAIRQVREELIDYKLMHGYPANVDEHIKIYHEHLNWETTRDISDLMDILSTGAFNFALSVKKSTSTNCTHSGTPPSSDDLPPGMN